jgi:hypothetical protein
VRFGSAGAADRDRTGCGDGDVTGRGEVTGCGDGEVAGCGDGEVAGCRGAFFGAAGGSAAVGGNAAACGRAAACRLEADTRPGAAALLWAAPFRAWDRRIADGGTVCSGAVSSVMTDAAGTAAPCCIGAGACFRRALGGALCHTRTVTSMSSFSANGAMRHQVRGSAMYRSCEVMSSGNRLLSITGRVVSQVSTPGGNTYSHTKLWLNGKPIAIRKTT